MTPMDNLSPQFSPATSAAAIQRLADTELALRSRLGYVALLLAALMMTGVVGALWATEPALPLRTQLGLAVMVVIGLSWVAFALWVLTYRRVLLARHSVVAGRMAVAFTGVFVVAALAVGYQTGGPEPYVAAAVGVVMLAGAIVVLVRAHRTFARLTERRLALERELGTSIPRQ